jgi:carbamoyltransferase
VTTRVVIGINDGHNASVAVVRDGELTRAIQEERLSRVKNQSGFPARGLVWCLEAEGAAAVLAARAGTTRGRPLNSLERARAYGSLGGALNRIMRRVHHVGAVRTVRSRRGAAAHQFAADCDEVARGRPIERFRAFDHHLCHAASAYYGLGEYASPVLVLTADGAGDGLCATVSLGRNGRLERLAAIPQSESIGGVYSLITFLLGMQPLEHEYKVMGLAPYADMSSSQEVKGRFSSLFTFRDERAIAWRRRPGVPPIYSSLAYFERLIRRERFDRIAAGLQMFLEELLCDWIGRCVRATGVRTVALSGGVFMNVKANQRILEMADVERLWVFPSCGDETNAIGAAYLGYVERFGHASLAPLRHLYLGPEFGPDEVLRDVRQAGTAPGLTWRVVDDPETELAHLLAAGEIVARFAGRAEFGARALGNRSLLADPSDARVCRTINEMVKMRDFWMPFASAFLDDAESDYIVNPKRHPAPYMTITFDTTARREEMLAGIHPYDFTVRPQVVTEAMSPRFHRLLRTFRSLTGRSALLNTSMNLHGEPLVHTVKDAVDLLTRSGLKHAMLENVLVQKVPIKS